MRIYLQVFLFCLCFNGFGQQIALTRGGITENLKTPDSLETSYNIYVPPTFNDSTAYRLLYISEPQGEASTAIRYFLSEKSNDQFIIAANAAPLADSLEMNIKTTGSVLKTLMKTFRIRPNSIYLAGIDEGAVTVSSLGFLANGITGVLAIQDIFYAPDFFKFRPRTITYGIVGDVQENVNKMKKALGWLRYYENKNKLLLIPESSWPPTNYLGTVFNNLVIQTQPDKKNQLSQEYVDNAFAKDLQNIEALINRGNYFMANQLVDISKPAYRGLKKLRPLRLKNRELRRNKTFKSQRRDRSRNAEKENLLAEELQFFLEVDIEDSNFANLGYWDTRIKELEEAAANSDKPFEQKSAQRLLYLIADELQEYENDLKNYNRRTLDNLLYIQVMKTVLDPKDYPAYLKAIELAAADKDFNTAYFYLEELLKNGYEDYDSLYEIPETEAIKMMPTYNEIINLYLNRSKY